MEFKQYPSYKNSGVEWLGDVPEHWSITPLKFAIKNWRNGKWGYDVVEASDDNLVCVRVADFDRQKGVINTEKLTLRNYKGERVSDCLLNENHILIERSGGGENQLVGATVKFSLNIKAVCSNFISLLEIKTNYFDLDFIQYYFDHLYSLNVNKLSIKQTSGIQNLDLKQYVQNHISFPEIFEQTQIVSFLDTETARIDNLIAKQEKLIELLEEQRKSIISHAVTKGLNPNAPMKDSGVEWLGEVPEHWDVKSYRFVSKIYRGKFGHRPRNDPSLYDGEYPFIQTGDVARAGKYIQTYSQTLNEKGKAVSQVFTSGTLVMAIAANIGDTAILNFEAYAPDSVVGFKPHKNIDLEFLRFSFIASLQALEQTAVQSTQANLNVERIGALKTTFPPLSEQIEISNYLNAENEKNNHLISKQNQLIEKLKEYRASIISHAVTGKIDVREFGA